MALVLAHGWFVKRPNLRGTWRVELQSDWIRPNDKCWRAAHHLLHGRCADAVQSSDASNDPRIRILFIAERINPSPSGVGYQVAGVYTNRPQIHLRGERSEVHLGGLLLDTHGLATVRTPSPASTGLTERRKAE